MDGWKLYYNPKCETCRRALILLNERGVRVEIVEYLKNPPSVKTLDALVRSLRVAPMDVVRVKEPLFEKLALAGKTRKDILRAISENPVLLQRPIVVNPNRKAVIARPPEKISELF